MARVLIVEDDHDLADLERELLVDAGAACVLVAHSLAELQRMREEQVLDCDTAILDVNLGVGLPSGIDVHAWLRGRGFTGAVVFLTGHAFSHPLVQAAAATPGTSILNKPVSATEIARFVA